MAGDRIAVGKIGRPHGVRGLVRIQSWTARPEDVAAYGPVETEAGRRLEIEVVAAAGDMVTARIEGVSDRDGARALNGAVVYIPRAALPEPGAEEFYHHDLIGLRAVDVVGADLGKVSAVHDYGAGAVLEIAAPDGEALMVPFTRDAAPEVDIAGGRIVLVPPAVLEENGGEEEEEDGAA